MRKGVLAGSTIAPPKGMALLLREGINAWRICGECTVRVERLKTLPQGVISSIPDAIQAGVIHVLATMAQGSREEMRS